MERKGRIQHFHGGQRSPKRWCEIATEKVAVRIAKSNGAVWFSTNATVACGKKRRSQGFRKAGCNWTFFEWEKSEHLKAKGLLAAVFSNDGCDSKSKIYFPWRKKDEECRL